MTRSKPFIRGARSVNRFAAMFCVAVGVALSGCDFKVTSSSETPPAASTTIATNATDPMTEIVDPAADEPVTNVETPSASESPPANQSASEAPVTNEPAADKSIAETKRPRPEETVAATFDDLNLQMQADMAFRDWMLTDRAKELDGRRIRISGAMLSDGQLKGVKQFVLLRNKECKFGPGGQADHLINVTMKGKQEVSYTTNSVQLEGILKIRPVNGPDGNTWSLYDLETDSFKVLRK